MNTQQFVFACGTLLALVGCGGGGGAGGSDVAVSSAPVINTPSVSVAADRHGSDAVSSPAPVVVVTPTPTPASPPAPVVIPVQNRALAAGAQADAGQTDDPAVDNVSYSGQVYYVDCVSGSDNNDGRAANRAWKTVAQVNTKTNVGYWDTAAPNVNTVPTSHAPWTAAPSGSAFLFKRGCTFDGFVNVHGYISLTNGVSVYADNITLGAYGLRNQARPVIQYQTASTKFRGTAVWSNGHAVSVRNLHLLGGSLANTGGLGLNNTSNVVVENSTIENFGLDGILADHVTNLLIKNTSIINTQNSGGLGGGLAGSGSNIQVLYSTFINNGRDKVGAHNIYLRHLTNATIQGNLVRGGSNQGLVIHGSSSGVSIVRNDIDGNSNGIGIDGGYAESEVFDNFVISENLIHGNGYRTGEQGYGMLIKSMTNSLIANNVIYGNRLGSMVFADANPGDPSSTGVQIIQNTFVDPATSYGVIFAGATLGPISFRNNIVSTLGTAVALAINTGVPSSAMKMSGNLYFAPQLAANRVLSITGTTYSVATAITAGREANSVYGNPLFTNEASADFTIPTNSPAKTAAPMTMLNVVSMVADYAGTARALRPSIGAYE